MSKVKILVECVIKVCSNWSSTRNFKDRERFEVFLILTRRALLSVLMVSIIDWIFIKPIANAVFSVGNFSVFLQLICIFIVKKNLNLQDYFS